MSAFFPSSLRGGLGRKIYFSQKTFNRQLAISVGVCLLWVLQTLAHAAQLSILPNKLELTGRDPLHGVVVSLTDDAGTVTDVTHRASFGVDRPETVTIDNRGMVTAQSDGQAILTATLDAISATIPVSVTTFAEKQNPSFQRDVLPILTRSGCNMGGCHGKLTGQNGFRLSLRGYAPEWDHDWITQEVSGRRVDFGSPENSLLLTKPSGGLPHEGVFGFVPTLACG